MNNDNALRDPTTANCRIYVGNLKENTPKIELQNIFSKYGNIRGVMVSRNFGFIQFDDESNANKAIESENQKLYNGRKIMVSKAKKNNQKQPDKGNNSGGGANNDNNTNQIAQNNSMLNASASEPNVNLSQQNNSNAPNNNSGNNNNNNNNPTNMGNVSQMQNTGNHQPRQQWRNRNNNRNNNNNEMNLNTDRERSPFDGRRDSNNDRWNQDNQGNSNFNSFRNNNNNNNNNRNNTMTHKNNTNNMNNMHNFGSNSGNIGNMSSMSSMNSMNNFGNNSGNMGNMGNMGGLGSMNNMNNMSSSGNNANSSGSGGGGNAQVFGFPNDRAKSVLNGGVLQGYASAREIRSKYPNANDCEIVVVEKHLVDYAEFIETRLKRSGIVADLLFPNADLTIGKMLTNIANRGALYALIIQPQHKENNSVTLNILYGIPQEHRNMPLDDAIAMIFRNYQQLCQGEKGDIIGDTDESPYASIPLANVRHPDSIQHLVNLLADNRTLTVLQIDCLLKYLQERRDSQYKFELGDTSADGQSSIGADNRAGLSPQDTEQLEAQQPKVNPEEEIQKRLMDILNKPSIPNINPETSPDKKVPTSGVESNSNIRQEPKLLAKDPNLRNVLDSIMLDGI